MKETVVTKYTGGDITYKHFGHSAPFIRTAAFLTLLPEKEVAKRKTNS